MLPALEDASRAARAIAAHGGEHSLAVWQARAGHQLYLPDDPVAALSDADKVAWLMRVDRETRAARSARHAGDGQRHRRA